MKRQTLILIIFLSSNCLFAIEPPLVKDTLLIQNSYNYPISKHSKFIHQRLGSHTIFGEAGYFEGYYKGLRYSVNFDGILQSSENNALTIRFGIGYSEATNDSTVVGSDIFFPIGIHLLFGIENTFDIGAGIYYYKNRQNFTPFIFLGFRHQNPRGGFMYRIGADIHLEHVYDLKGNELQKTAVFGPLISLGWSF